MPCFNGVTMEYADILETKNMRAVSDVTIPTRDSLSALCMFESLPQSRACFRYFLRYVIATLAPLGYTRTSSMQAARKICTSYPVGDHRTACISGIGSYYSYDVITDHKAGEKFCNQFPNTQDRASCILGEVFVAVTDRKANISRFCGELSDAPLKQSCYQDLFHYLYIFGEPMDKTGPLCEKGDSLCEGARSEYMLDSWREIRKL